MTATWLVAYDFSELAHAAVLTAAEMLSRQGGGRLLVVHVHQIGAPIDDSGSEVATFAGGDLQHAYVRDAERQLAEELATIDAPAVTLEPRVVSGRAALVICRLAAEERASLIVVGSHGRRGLQRFILGSVAEAVLRHAGTSVLVVKHRPYVTPGP